MREGRRLLILATLVVAATAVIFSRPLIPQPASYHDFADQRAFFGVPTFMDVVSNLPFLFVGVWGQFFVAGRKSSSAFLTGSERWAYAVFFLGVALTFFGAGYYHLHPTNAHLVWDRLPMTLGFMGLLSATIGLDASFSGATSSTDGGHRRGCRIVSDEADTCLLADVKQLKLRYIKSEKCR